MSLIKIILFVILMTSGIYEIANVIRDRYLDKIKLNNRRRGVIRKNLIGLVMPDTEEQERMETQMRRVGMSETIEEYYSAILTRCALIVIGALMVSLISPVFGCLMLVAAVLQWYAEMDKLPAAIRRKNSMVLEELPRFMRTFVYGMQYEKDILAMVETYCEVAGKGLKNDLVALAQSMENGNYEEALRDFDKAISIPQLSRFTSALISIHRGEDQTSVLLDITDEITAMERERLRAKLMRVPDRIQALSIPVVICIMAIYLFVIGYSFIESMNIIF